MPFDAPALCPIRMTGDECRVCLDGGGRTGGRCRRGGGIDQQQAGASDLGLLGRPGDIERRELTMPAA